MHFLTLYSLSLVQIIHALPLKTPLLHTYDFIVVGGGPAGLTVANRLSEDPNVTVLVLEAGPADHNELYIEVPGLIGADIGSVYDWNLSTVPQSALDGKTRNLPQGHGLGGGTLLNGMLWNRGGREDYADWVALGNPGWGWDDLVGYFMKSETFTPVTDVGVARQFSIEENPAVHGISGPVNVSFPHYFWNSSAVLFSALNELGIPTAYDPNEGLVAGASFLPLDLDPTTEMRSTARRAYFDPVQVRANLWVATGQYVTQILFGDAQSNTDASQQSPNDSSVGQGSSPGVPGGIFGNTTTLPVAASTGLRTRRWLSRLTERVRRSFSRRQASPGNLTAIGVEFTSSAAGTRWNVSATREVIIAAGAIHSPQILMLSGIGPSAALESFGISENINLPGVGNNLQDHGQTWCWYPYENMTWPSPLSFSDSTFAADAWAAYWANATGPLTTGAVDGVAFPSLPAITNASTTLANLALSQSASEYLAPNLDPTIIAGYKRQLRLLASALTSPTRAAYELLNANDGVLTVSTMRPFSRGTVTLASTDPFAPPLIDPRYASNPLDAQVLIAAIRFNEALLNTPSLSALGPSLADASPPVGASDEALGAYIRAHMQSEYHPSGTCAMLPRALGGVVDSQLKVYGTRNLRVVDSSVFPLLPAAHLQAVVYGVAEKAADIIKEANRMAISPPLGSSSSPSVPSDSEDPGATDGVANGGGESGTTYVTVYQTHTVYV